MSQKKVTKTVMVCDQCGKEDAYYKCRVCGGDFCYECHKSYCIEYQKQVYFNSSDDGLYCPACDAKAAKRGDLVRKAFLAVKQLRDERAALNAEFEKRREAAEKHLEKLLKEAGEK
jgi:hypothetical protein